MGCDRTSIQQIFAGKHDLGISAAQGTTFLLTTHTSPDGDAIGSLFAGAHICSAFGGTVWLYLPEGVPAQYHWLACPWPVITSLEALQEYAPQVVMAFDCGDDARSGEEMKAVWKKESPYLSAPYITVNIDHHTGNNLFGDYNLVQDSEAATGEIVGNIAEELRLSLQGSLGAAVYIALVADTGNFSFANTHGSTLAMAGRILDLGLNIEHVTNCMDNTWSLGKMALWGELMQSVQLHYDGRIASSIVSQAQLSKYNADKNDLEGFAAQLRRLQGVEVALFIREDGNNICKMSFRSIGGRNVRDLAACFGGGGHIRAAGAVLHMGPEAALEAVLAKIDEIGTMHSS